MEITFGAGVLRKVAGSDAERNRLAGEARVLRASAHPGVVRLIEVVGGDPPSELILARVEGNDLRAWERRLDWSEIAGLGAALATALADLHHIGIIHGAISAEHVLLDEGGRPVLCGFGEATCFQDRRDARSLVAEDVTSLAQLLLQFGDGTPPHRLIRAFRSCGSRRRMGGILDARALARALVKAVPSARLPGSAPVAAGPVGPAQDERRRRRGVIRGFAGIAVALAVAGAVIGVRSALAGDRNAQLAAGCPPADGGCVAQRVVSGSVLRSPAGKFALVGPAGIEVNGRWGCSAVAVPAVLDMANGNVWVFDGWPTDPAGAPGRLLTTVPGAAGIRVVPGSGRGSSCDRLLVERRQGPSVALTPTHVDGRGPAVHTQSGSGRQQGANP